MANTRMEMTVYGYYKKIPELVAEVWHQVVECEDEDALDSTLDNLDICHQLLEKIINDLVNARAEDE